MPIYEFRCSKCEELFELLIMGTNAEQVETRCTKCGSAEFERVLSTAGYSMGKSSGSGAASSGGKTRTCASGSCTTWDLPGPS